MYYFVFHTTMPQGSPFNNLNIKHLIYPNINKKRRNATKPGFQRFNQELMWQE